MPGKLVTPPKNLAGRVAFSAVDVERLMRRGIRRLGIDEDASDLLAFSQKDRADNIEKIRDM